MIYLSTYPNLSTCQHGVSQNISQFSCYYRGLHNTAIILAITTNIKYLILKRNRLKKNIKKTEKKLETPIHYLLALLDLASAETQRGKRRLECGIHRWTAAAWTWSQASSRA